MGAWAEEWVGPGVGKPLGTRALPTGSLLPLRHSAEAAPALKQQLLACEPTASHPCCGGNKGCDPPPAGAALGGSGARRRVWCC